jgi:hypothetical protein
VGFDITRHCDSDDPAREAWEFVVACQVAPLLAAPCPVCEGRGDTHEGNDGTQMHYVTCDACDGTGVAPPAPKATEATDDQ